MFGIIITNHFAFEGELMRELDGVTFQKEEKYSVFCVRDFSEDIKGAIREQLALICHGVDNVNTGRRTYNYKNTVKEFLKRYETKPVNIKIGMIGELLVHLIFQNYFDEYKSVTPYFNMEERSIKKGYDAVLTETNTPVLWIIEVKSGELHLNKTSDQTIVDLIGTAKNDLDVRLNQDNVSLWLEAVNGAKISFDNNDLMKEAVLDILRDWSDDATDGVYTSGDKNVILTGVLFSDLSDSITSNNLQQKQGRIERTGEFSQVYVLGIQKETYTKVYQFLREEAEDEN